MGLLVSCCSCAARRSSLLPPPLNIPAKMPPEAALKRPSDASGSSTSSFSTPDSDAAGDDDDDDVEEALDVVEWPSADAETPVRRRLLPPPRGPPVVARAVLADRYPWAAATWGRGAVAVRPLAGVGAVATHRWIAIPSLRPTCGTD